ECLRDMVCTGRGVRTPDFIKIADEGDVRPGAARCLAYHLMVMSERDSELAGVDYDVNIRATQTEAWANAQS
ncbi:hypothetical protein ACM9HD_34155, partial [Streptomyces sp. JAC25]|uniref:hypothetical protein n=1 Tax=Streptomyces sp. JAC25 TaxID=3418413 RepID=UPI003D81B4E3